MNIATQAQIEERLRSAGDFIGAMIQFEFEAFRAAKEGFLTTDFSGQSEALRKFQREFEAFISSTRTAWNYMNQLSNAAGTRRWLNGRLESKLCELHRELANTDTHSSPMIFGIREKIGVEGTAIFPGGDIRDLLAFRVPLTATGIHDFRLVYEPKNLPAKTALLCKAVIRKYPDETVVELCSRYQDILARTCRTGKQSGKFEC